MLDAQEGKEYIIHSIETDDEELDAFLFSVLTDFRIWELKEFKTSSIQRCSLRFP